MNDIRCKMWLFLLVAIASFIAKDIMYNAILYVIIACISFCFGQRMSLLKYTAIYMFFVGLHFLAYISPATIGGIFLTITLFIRMFIPLLLYAKSFMASIKVCEIITALYRLKIPRSFVITLAVVVRFFPSVGYEIKQVQTAMKLRGIEVSFKNIFTKPMLLLESFIVPILVRASTIADELAAASITRGLDNPNPRTAYFELKLEARDVALTGVFSLLILATLIVRYIS